MPGVPALQALHLGHTPEEARPPAVLSTGKPDRRQCTEARSLRPARPSGLRGTRSPDPGCPALPGSGSHRPRIGALLPWPGRGRGGEELVGFPHVSPSPRTPQSPSLPGSHSGRPSQEVAATGVQKKPLGTRVSWPAPLPPRPPQAPGATDGARGHPALPTPHPQSCPSPSLPSVQLRARRAVARVPSLLPGADAAGGGVAALGGRRAGARVISAL